MDKELANKQVDLEELIANKQKRKNPPNDGAECYRRYRDPVGRREYMRVYMAKRRKRAG